MTLVMTQCDQCGQFDDHPKVHSFTGGTVHHDCASHKLKVDILAGTHSQHVTVAAKLFKAAEDGMRGQELREYGADLELRDYGDATMATTGIDQTMAHAILTALSPTSATATIGTVTITFPIKCRFDSTMTTTDTGASTEWTTAGGYTAGGVSVGANWAAAASGSRATNAAITVTSAPAQTWAGNELWDSSGSPLRTLWGVISGGSKTVNSGDTCTIASGALSQALS